MSSALLNLPVELVDHIASFIPPTQQKALSNLSLTCRTLYNLTIPILYRTLRIHFRGRDSWSKHVETILALTPPGSYKLPEGISAANDTKGKGVAGRPSKYPSGCNYDETTERRLATTFIRNIEVSGYWAVPTERDGHSAFAKDETVDQAHKPFLQALEGLLYSIDELQSFQWQLIMEISPRITVALSRYDSLKNVEINCDTHMVKSTAPYIYASNSQPSIPVMDPSPLAHLSLTRLHVNQLGDQNQAIQYGDVIRSPTNWKSLRHIKVDISKGFIATIMDLEPLDPDVLFSLFRVPPPPRGMFQTPKMKLESLKLKELGLMDAGLDALEKAVDPTTLRMIDLRWCHDGSSIIKMWADNKLKNLEKLVLIEQKHLYSFSKYLKQFGPEGKCRKLRHLDLSCTARRSDFLDSYMGFDMDGDDSDSDGFGDGMDDEMFFNPALYPHAFNLTGGPAGALIIPPLPQQVLAGFSAAAAASSSGGPFETSSSPKDFDYFPPTWKAIRDLRGSQEEGWGLERLFLEITDPIIPVHKQDIFYDGFWNLRYLATPVSYQEHDNWSQFVTSVANLPNLHALYLLNRRPIPCAYHGHHDPAYPANFHLALGLGDISGPGVHPFVPPPRPTAASRRQTSKRKTKSSRPAEDPPDQIYIDALSIAAANRMPHLYSHHSADPSSSPLSHEGGKLEYIAVRAPVSPVSIYSVAPRTCRVFKVVVKKAEVKKVEVELDEKSLERKRSLRSSTIKRRKVEEPGDWRVKREGEWEVRLDEVREVGEKQRVAEGWFGGERKEDGDVLGAGIF